MNKVHEWAIKNEMTFGINKCATLDVQPINFVKTNKLRKIHLFFIGNNKLPKKLTTILILVIPFDEFLSIETYTIQIKQ